MKTYTLENRPSFKQGDTVRFSFLQSEFEKGTVLNGKIVGKVILENLDFWIVEHITPLNDIYPDVDYPYSCFIIPHTLIVNENL